MSRGYYNVAVMSAGPDQSGLAAIADEMAAQSRVFAPTIVEVPSAAYNAANDWGSPFSDGDLDEFLRTKLTRDDGTTYDALFVHNLPPELSDEAYILNSVGAVGVRAAVWLNRPAVPTTAGGLKPAVAFSHSRPSIVRAPEAGEQRSRVHRLAQVRPQPLFLNGDRDYSRIFTRA